MSKKGENIYKRKDKRWEARYIKGYHADGTARYGYCYGKSYREAKEKVEFAKAALLTKTPSAVGKRHRLAEYCDEWLLFQRMRVKDSTFVKYSTTIQKHIKPRLGGCQIGTLSTVVVGQFTQELLYEEELSPKTVKDILIVLRAVLNYISHQDPTAFTHIDFFYPKDPRNEMRVLTKDEQRRFVRYLLEDMDTCKFGTLLALLTGMRIGEICALRWENISLRDKTVRINSTMQRLQDLHATHSKTKVVITEPKSETSARVIPLTDYATELCRRYSVASPEAFVLTGDTRQFIEPRTLQNRMRRYTQDCGLCGVHFHTLRHTFATRCVEVGFEIKSLSEILGHASPKITLERYVHSSMELKRDNMNKVAMII